MTTVAVRDADEVSLRLDVGRDQVDERAELVMARIARTFDLASRILPAPVRRDVRRLYLVLRTLDDLVDHADPGAEAAIADVEAWASGEPPRDTLSQVLADLAARHPGFPHDAVADFCAGMRADLAGPVHRTEADLSRYCDQVAGTVGRMMASLLGVKPGREAEAEAAARSLGIAMQRTNILRDLIEDAGRGRVYMPHEAFHEVGLAPGDGMLLLAELTSWPVETRAAFVLRQASQAEAEYRAGLAGVRLLRSGRRSIVAAALMYREILRQIEREDFGGRRPRVVVSRVRKVALVARAALFGR